MSQWASHAPGDMDVWLLSVCLARRWWALYCASAGSWERCNRSTLVEIKRKASEHCAIELPTAGRRRMRTHGPHVSRVGMFIREGRIAIVFRRDVGCSQHMTCVTKDLIMFDVAMEYHGVRFRRSNHPVASLAPLEETLFDTTQRHLPDNTRGVNDRVVEDTKRYECKGDDDRCGVDRPTLSPS